MEYEEFKVFLAIQTLSVLKVNKEKMCVCSFVRWFASPGMNDDDDDDYRYYNALTKLVLVTPNTAGFAGPIDNYVCSRIMLYNMISTLIFFRFFLF